MGTTILDIIYLMVMIIGIAFGLIVVISMISRNATEERKKRADTEMMVFEKILNAATDKMVDVFAKVKSIEEDKITPAKATFRIKDDN